MAWARIVICALFMWASNIGVVAAFDAVHGTAVHCFQMVSHDCVLGSPDGAPPTGACSSLACNFALQIPVCCSLVAHTRLTLDLPMPIDLPMEGLSISPDLRPPIFQLANSEDLQGA